MKKETPEGFPTGVSRSAGNAVTGGQLRHSGRS